jgi:hypothetical protein
VQQGSGSLFTASFRGALQISKEKLQGVLSPLEEATFFVLWLGEI